jgi:hypothetical protein
MSRDALPAPEIPQSIDEVTPAWLTGVLRSSGHLERGRVVRREPELLGEGAGFVGQIVRLRLAYDVPESRAPESLIVKLPIRVAQNRQVGEALGAYEREVRFYAEIADRVPIAKPACYHAAMDPNPFAGREKETLEFLDRLPRWLVRLLVPFGMWLATKSRRRYLLLLEDLAPSRRLGDQVAGCSRDEAEAVLRRIAIVHAAWWQDPELEQPSMGWVAPVSILSRYVEVMFRKGRVSFFETFGANASREFAEFSEWLQDHGTPVMKRLGAAPYTLIHGDYRLDNLFFRGEGREAGVTVFDWQTVSRGPGVLDVAYFIGGNLAREVAAACDMQLLRSYHDELLSAGVRDYDFEQCLADYQISMLFIAYRMIAGMHLLDFSNERGTALIRGWFERLDPLLPRNYREILSP